MESLKQRKYVICLKKKTMKGLLFSMRKGMCMNATWMCMGASIGREWQMAEVMVMKMINGRIQEACVPKRGQVA